MLLSNLREREEEGFPFCFDLRSEERGLGESRWELLNVSTGAIVRSGKAIVSLVASWNVRGREDCSDSVSRWVESDIGRFLG